MTRSVRLCPYEQDPRRGNRNVGWSSAPESATLLFWPICRDFARAFPKLDDLAVNELLGSFARRWFVDAIKFKAKLYVAVRSKNVGSILRHELLQNISSEAETRENYNNIKKLSI
ncbi:MULTISPECIES: hypothetical protein [unclassified Bradyrhizobium]|jgi:hypothetical protein|uniref:hypothetical protein n=1 Tax=unclassified Bradyrhizobium TaxID=2631580 RepID=UPI0012F8480D|nr:MULTISPECIES: hypothetical protein [unclassified Bradyrhizobium]MCK1324703.1 hypothetical protein [Bradyrhizobium sp. 156]MCK1342409.1 hypothetical protein [Bradyrhizobium sp. CW11]MCK1466576.1 hypothetical protein [Bradyrhizobium sp. CW10]MCK1486547.1 hypothetical protein [Bradyrhizobium sp. 193]MCK1497228.1 hypothetical protein [Bradyrhizobium sp. 188]